MLVPVFPGGLAAFGQQSAKPNILFIVSDDTGLGDLGPYGGGEGRGMPTPNFDRLAADGMTFFSFYAQPSCTPGRAAMQTGRIPNRSGMTTVAFQGQGGGLPAAEWTLASVLKKAGYRTYFTGKWHLGEADYALPNAHGYDVMEHCFLYHLNAYTYGDPNWFPDMDPKLRAMFDRVTKGSLSGLAGQPAKEDWKVNGAWQDVYPDAGYTPLRGTKGTDREGGNRVPAIAVWPGKIKPDVKNHDIIGGLDLMATFASVAGLKLPEKDREGQPIYFDSYDMTPVLCGTGKCPRNAWFYFTENELTPGAARVGHYKAVFNLRGDDGQATGGLAVDSNLGWKGPNKYVATTPQIFDLWQDPQERYDVFMNNYTEHTWTLITFNEAIGDLMKTYIKYPPRKLQSEVYTGPITISDYQRFQFIREQLKKEGVNIPLPTGN
ncbi:MAG: sulfatase-like hydrolase/transferase [Pirellulales bacterium]|nr:sulfatase-like hydrolase/transferase [Pirellulales bacterium]